MKSLLIVSVGVLALLLCSIHAGYAAEEQTIEEWPEEVEIELGKSKDYVFSVEENEKKILLEFEARIDREKKFGGILPFMGITLNEKPVEAMKDRLNVRLLNKKEIRDNKENRTIPWYRKERNAWSVACAADFESANKHWRYKFAGQAYRFVIDITDMVKPGGENTLAFNNLTKQSWCNKWNEGKQKILIIRNVKIKQM